MIQIVAEAGVNHDGSWEKALDLVDIAKYAGADAVKFQIFNAETCQGKYRDILKPLQLSNEAHKAVKAHCDEVGIRYMASCFDCPAVDFAIDLGCDVIKVGSGELTNHKLISYIARRGLPMILSTGMATLAEVDAAVMVYGNNDGPDFMLLHCVSNYPTAVEHCNMLAIRTLQWEFDCEVGFSDHTVCWMQPTVAALALGAVMLEKHFTYDHRAEGPDHHMSLQPAELKEYVYQVRRMEQMLGDGKKVLQPGEAEMQKVARGRWS